MSRKAREDVLDNVLKYGDTVRDRCFIGEIDRELSLYEIAMMTRAGPAKALGLAHMFGSLKPGLEGDVVVYPFNPETDDDPEKIEQAFSNCSFLVKSGQLVIDKGEIVSNGKENPLGRCEGEREPAGHEGCRAEIPEILQCQPWKLRGHRPPLCAKPVCHRG